MYNLGSYSYVQPDGIDEHIGPSSTQGYYVSYILKNKGGTKWMTPW